MRTEMNIDRDENRYHVRLTDRITGRGGWLPGSYRLWLTAWLRGLLALTRILPAT